MMDLEDQAITEEVYVFKKTGIVNTVKA